VHPRCGRAQADRTGSARAGSASAGETRGRQAPLWTPAKGPCLTSHRSRGPARRTVGALSAKTGEGIRDGEQPHQGMVRMH
jgi:hypothetical protein